MSVASALGRQKREDHSKFEASLNDSEFLVILSYRVKPCLNKEGKKGEYYNTTMVLKSRNKKGGLHNMKEILIMYVRKEKSLSTAVWNIN